MWVTGSASVFLVMLGGAGTFLGLVRPFSRHGPARCGETGRTSGYSTPGTLAAWMLTAWLVGLLATIPLYMAYPRLVLPLLVASWLGAGILVDTLMGLIRSQAGQRLAVDQGTSPLLTAKHASAIAIARFRPVFILALGVAIVLAAQQRSPFARGVPGWESRTSIAQIAPAIVDDACRDAGVDPQAQFKKLVIYSYGEPALVFNLRLAGAEFVNPVKDVRFASPDAPPPQLPSFLTIGPQAWGTLGFGEQLVKALPRLQSVGKYRYVQSDLVVLDDSIELIRFGQRTEHEIELYRVK
jgi:hypothetical protein